MRIAGSPRGRRRVRPRARRALRRAVARPRPCAISAPPTCAPPRCSAPTSSRSCCVDSADEIELVSQQPRRRVGERWSLDDFPSTRYVLEHRVPGPGRRRRRGRRRGRARASWPSSASAPSCIVPVICGDEPLARARGLPRAAQAFTAREVDRARVLAQQFGAALDRLPTSSKLVRACPRGSARAGSRAASPWRRGGGRRSRGSPSTSWARTLAGSTSVVDGDAARPRRARRSSSRAERRDARADVVDAGLAAGGEQPVGADDVAHVGEVAARVGAAGDDADRVLAGVRGRARTAGRSSRSRRSAPGPGPEWLNARAWITRSPYASA